MRCGTAVHYSAIGNFRKSILESDNHNTMVPLKCLRLPYISLYFPMWCLPNMYHIISMTIADYNQLCLVSLISASLLCLFTLLPLSSRLFDWFAFSSLFPLPSSRSLSPIPHLTLDTWHLFRRMSVCFVDFTIQFLLGPSTGLLWPYIQQCFESYDLEVMCFKKKFDLILAVTAASLLVMGPS